MPRVSSLHSSLFPVGAALLVGAALQDSFAPPTFSPGAGSVAERTYTWAISSSTGDVDVLLGGEPSDLVPVVKSEKSSEASLELKDTFVRSGTNQYLELRRSFEDISYEAEGELQIEYMGGGGAASLAIACDGDSDLDGVAVDFAWDENSGAYRVKYAEDYEGEEELLEPLRPGADFLGLLPDPEESVEIGQSWAVSPSVLREVLLPSGRVPITLESDMSAIEGAVDPLLLPGVLDTLDGEADGEIEVTVKERDEDTITLSISVDVQFEASLGDAVAELLDGAAPEEVELEMRQAEFVSAFDGKGVLVWDLGTGLPRSLQLDLSTELIVAVEVFVGGGGVDAPFELKEDREGTLAFTMETAE